MITHKSLPVSPWVARYAPLIPLQLGSARRVLDLACGTGRHAIFLAKSGYAVLAVDRDQASLESLRLAELAEQLHGIERRCLDLEAPVFCLEPATEKFVGIIVTNYLYRPHLQQVLDLVQEGGGFIYETFALGNEQWGRPTNPAFLLKDNELVEVLMAHQGFRIMAFESTYIEDPKPAMIQRIYAIRTSYSATIPK